MFEVIYYAVFVQLLDTAGNVRTLVPAQFGGSDGSLFIGTTHNCIIEGSLQDKFNFIAQVSSQQWIYTL